MAMYFTFLLQFAEEEPDVGEEEELEPEEELEDGEEEEEPEEEELEGGFEEEEPEEEEPPVLGGARCGPK